MDCDTLPICYNEDIKFHVKHANETVGWGVNYVHQNKVRKTTQPNKVESNLK